MMNKILLVVRNMLTFTFFRQTFDALTEFVLENVYPIRIMERGKKSSISSSARFFHPENIIIGTKTNINRDCRLWAGKNSKIIIGDNCLTGPGVSIFSSKYKVKSKDLIRSCSSYEADVIIGNDVWLGANCIILPGVVIGDGAIIGSGSVISRNVNNYTIVSGPKATFLKNRIQENE